jgi:alkylated DNA repair dioxygenase AlkB
MSETITLTFGDAGENHAGMKIIGKIGDIGSGFTKEDLVNAKEIFESKELSTELINLNDLANIPSAFQEEAYLLVIRNGLEYFIGDRSSEMFQEMNSFEWDSKYYDTRRSKVLNKRARTNVCFGDLNVEPDYENKQGRIVSYSQVPLLKQVKDKLSDILGDKGRNLICEGNRYYDTNKCGIGWHGDSERKKVIGVRLGNTIPLKFRWYNKSKTLGECLKLDLNNGDIYIMSEKTTGYDWKKRNLYTLRHCAGSEKYTKE